MIILGLDLGTTTLSALAVDGDSGEVLEARNIPNGAALAGAEPFDRLQDPDVIAERAAGLVAELKEKYAISSIGIDGQMHGIVYVDARGRAVSPLYTWQDQRGELPLGGTTYAGELARRTGYAMATGYGMVTHFWHARNGRVPDGAAKLCSICDYVGMRLTGRSAPLVHVSSAAGMGLVDPASGGWDPGAFDRAGIDAGILPEIANGCAPLGRDKGGIPVSCGIGDNQASFIGAMRDAASGALVNMGTGGQISMLAPGTRAPEGLEVRPLGGGKAILVGSMLCGGRAYALLEGFLRSCARLGGGGDAPLYEAMNRVGLEMLEAPELMRVDTRFSGTRAEPGLRGSIANVGTGNFDAAHLIGGTLMGMANEIHGMYEAMLAAGCAPAERLVGSGNAIRRNPALRRAFELAFGAPMRIPAHAEEAAYGAALFGMAAAGLAPSLEATQRLIRYA